MKLVHMLLQQGQRKDFEGAELAEMKDSAILFDELLLATKRPLLVSRPLTVKILTPLKTVKQRSIMM
jgi:hypothetical protein